MAPAVKQVAVHRRRVHPWVAVFMARTGGPESQASELTVPTPQGGDEDRLKGVLETLLQGIEELKFEAKGLYEELQ